MQVKHDDILYIASFTTLLIIMFFNLIMANM
jgi:hypothetical protein